MKGEIIYMLKSEQIEAILKYCTMYTKMAVCIKEDFSHEPKIFIEYFENGEIKTISI